MATCKTCGKKYHWCSSCSLDYHWEPDFCTSECYYDYLKTDPKLEPLKRILFQLTPDELDSLCEIDGNILCDLLEWCSNNQPESI